MNKKVLGIAITLIAILVVIFVATAIYYSIPVDQTPPLITIDLPTFSGKAGQLVTLEMNVRNDGGYAEHLLITLTSDAFEVTTSAPLDLEAKQTGQTSADVQVKEVNNGEYQVALTYSYDDTGQISSNTQAKFYVIPSLQIVYVHWFQPLGFPIISEKSIIGPQDSTELYFKVRSESDISMYSSLSAKAMPETNIEGLTLTPTSLNIENIGPSGTTHDEYSLKIVSHNVPVGRYKIAIVVFADGIYESDREMVELVV